MDKTLFWIRRDILSSRIGLSTLQKLVLSALLAFYHASNEKDISVTVFSLAKFLGVTEKKTINALEKMYSRGLIRVKSRYIKETKKGETNVYVLNLMPIINEYFPDAYFEKAEPEEYRVEHNEPLNDEETENYIRAARGTYKLHNRQNLA